MAVLAVHIIAQKHIYFCRQRFVPKCVAYIFDPHCTTFQGDIWVDYILREIERDREREGEKTGK